MKSKMRKHLSAPGLLKIARDKFSKIKDPLAGKSVRYNLTDCLMSGLAVFGLKCPSLLDFDSKRDDEVVQHNLNTLYGVKQAPCDTQLRQRLDELSPSLLARVYKGLFSAAQRGKELPLYESLDEHYIISVDGTGVFHSNQVHCRNCCRKNHRDGTTSYYHQLLSGVMVHPNQKEVIPMYSEPIIQQDGSNKNDCERNAAKRLWSKLRRMHPNLKMMAVEDALYANAPHIDLLRSLDVSYVIGVKPTDHEWLFDWVQAYPNQPYTMDRDQKRYELIWHNDVPLNEGREDLKVNFLECWETDAKGKRQHFTWITNLKITKENALTLMKIGRSRWKIENETFNTLKNQGYHFEHNFGHGNKHLCNIFAHLMMLAFLIDQLQQMCCPLFQKALKACFRRKRFWEKLRHWCTNCYVESWQVLYQAIVSPPKFTVPTKPPDTS